MKNILHFILKLTITWYSVFFINRLIQLFYFSDKIQGNFLLKAIQIIFHSLRLDFSVVGYLLIIPIIFSLPLFFFKNFSQIYRKINLLGFYFFLILTYLISLININLLREWGEKISVKSILIFIDFPYQSLISSYSPGFFLTLSIFLIFFILSLIFFKKWIFNLEFEFSQLKLSNSWLWLGLVLFNITIIRGGWQLTPINTSMAYFSKNPFENNLTTNPHWELFEDALEKDDDKANLYSFGLNTQSILKDNLENNNQKPLEILNIDSSQKLNVVIILLESFTADIIEPLGGIKGVTPHFNDLVNQGLFFTNFYATGDRTDKGLLGVLSGFPSQAYTSVIRQSKKEKNLGSLVSDFNKNSYYTSFYYGGESEFFGMKSYFFDHQIDTIIDLKNFPSELNQSKWGVFDEYIFDRQLITQGKSPQPFFSTILTLSNHEPFDLPVKPHFPGLKESEKFKSTAYYVDSVLYQYFEKVKKQDWYKNTLFFVVADHGHRLPLNLYPISDYHRFRIPFLILGEPLKRQFRGVKITDYGSQTDIRATINYLAQLNGYSSDLFSQNLLIPNKNKTAFFDWDGGFGRISSQFDFAFDVKTQKTIRIKSSLSAKQTQIETLKAKAYMQKIMEEYQSLD